MRLNRLAPVRISVGKLTILENEGDEVFENAPARAFPVATRLERHDLSSSTSLAAGSFNNKPGRRWKVVARLYIRKGASIILMPVFQ